MRTRSKEDSFRPEMIRNADIRSGFREFQEYCVHCHGAPGVQPHEWTTGMTPNPPELSNVTDYWSPDEIFWIVKHGVKMTGMPPFGDTESDETIRNMVAFVEQLDGMTAAEYSRLQQAWGTPGGHQHTGSGHSASAAEQPSS